VEGGERLRLFLALPLPDEARERLASWQAAELAGASGARVVPPENLHVTLAFLGGRPAGEEEAIMAELRAAAEKASPPALVASGYRETRSVGMVVLEDVEGRATSLAEALGERLERLGVYRREARPWLPHVTVLRFRRQPRLRPAPPDLGPVSPSEAALYTSVLRRTGAQYEIRESVALGG
jgi:RNA 2',3'-cyclic 3'-phosphodiesterase